MLWTCMWFGWLFASVLLSVTNGNNISQPKHERPHCQPGRQSCLQTMLLVFISITQQQYSTMCIACQGILLSLLGFYYPLESLTPLPCPKGTYGPTAGALSIDSCLNCPPQHYCPRPGLRAALPCGPVAQQSLSGQDTCTCPGEGHIFQVFLVCL